jgi:hypothetical protein
VIIQLETIHIGYWTLNYEILWLKTRIQYKRETGIVADRNKSTYNYPVLENINSKIIN